MFVSKGWEESGADGIDCDSIVLFDEKAFAFAFENVPFTSRSVFARFSTVSPFVVKIDSDAVIGSSCFEVLQN